MRILFANIGWMAHYRGNNAKDQIKGGGSYRDDDKHEAFNFLPINGKCYGYVQPVRWGGINLNRIEAGYQDDKMSNVLVVWIATHPSAGGTYIVGWYKNANVFKTFQDSKNPQRKKYNYNIVAKTDDCTLLPIDQRTFQVLRAKSGGKGFLGQSNVWYADSSNKNIQQFKEEVIAYIKSYTGDAQHISKQALKVNSEARKKVEVAAVTYVTKVYQKLGYKVTSREKENIGWDLDAEKKGIKLKLEVKGLAQSQVSVRISENEYKSMMANKNDYRLCVVTNALKNHPVMVTFIWDEDKNAWLSDRDPNIILSIELKPSYLAVVE
jgi:hypothetical protein